MMHSGWSASQLVLANGSTETLAEPGRRHRRLDVVHRSAVSSLSHMAFAVLIGLALIAFAFPTHAVATDAKPPITPDDYKKVVADPENDVVFKDFLAKLPSVVVGTETKRFYYILEGDLLLTEQRVRATIRNYANDPRPALPSGELKVMTEGGQPVFWKPADRKLSYAVDQASFRTPAEYKLIVTNMEKAAAAWVGACPECGVSFTHKADADAHPVPADVTFVITFVPNETGFVAASFFPNDPVDKRTFLIAPSYFSAGPDAFDKVGVLRHELGHVLGYRHEHISNVPGCFSEDNNWKPLTGYDKLSVMHYFCGGGGSIALILTDSDKKGHRALYHIP
jgi:hypothetical protein